MFIKIIRLMGRKGNVTVPYAIRVLLGMHPGDILSFAVDGDKVILHKEKLCDGCTNRDCGAGQS